MIITFCKLKYPYHYNYLQSLPLKIKQNLMLELHASKELYYSLGLGNNNIFFHWNLCRHKNSWGKRLSSFHNKSLLLFGIFSSILFVIILFWLPRKPRQVVFIDFYFSNILIWLLEIPMKYNCQFILGLQEIWNPSFIKLRSLFWYSCLTFLVWCL